MKSRILTVTLNPCIDKTIVADELKYGQLNCLVSMMDDVGGKGINVSKVLSTFDVELTTYALGAGNNGSIVGEEVRKIGGNAIVDLCDGENRINIKIRDQKTGITTEINDRTFSVDKSVVQRITKKLESLMDNFDIMVLAGSLPKGMGDDFYAHLIRKAKEHRLKVILDADMQKLKCAIAEKPYAIKPNIYEFGELNGKEYSDITEVVSDAKALAESGISLVVVSLGADGAVFVNSEGAVLAKPFEIECRSTVGAGDSMVATMAYAISVGAPLEDIARMGVTAGSLTSSMEGTQVCNCGEIMSRKNDVNIQKL